MNERFFKVKQSRDKVFYIGRSNDVVCELTIF